MMVFEYKRTMSGEGTEFGVLCWTGLYNDEEWFYPCDSVKRFRFTDKYRVLLELHDGSQQLLLEAGMVCVSTMRCRDTSNGESL